MFIKAASAYAPINILPHLPIRQGMCLPGILYIPYRGAQFLSNPFLSPTLPYPRRCRFDNIINVKNTLTYLFSEDQD